MSLYKIEQDLLRIFDAIEQAEGEITPEMAAELEITEENLKVKLGNYIKAVRSYEGDIAVISEEVKKLSAVATVRQNRVDRLKKSMLTALELFGNIGKSGNRVIELTTNKIYTKATPSVQVNDERVKRLLIEFDTQVRELVSNDILATGDDVSIEGLLDVINANIKAEYDAHNVDELGLEVNKPFEPYTRSDLLGLKLQVTVTKNVADLFKDGGEELKLYVNNPNHARLNNVTGKPDWKTAIGIVDMLNDTLDSTGESNRKDEITVAKIVKNNSIIIK